MRVRQAGDVLLVHDTPGCFWILGLWFIAGGTLAIGVLGATASRLAWWQQLSALIIGVAYAGAGLLVIYTSPGTHSRLNRSERAGSVEIRGLLRQKRTAFTLDEVSHIDVVQSRDSDGDMMYQIRLWLTDSRVLALQARPTYGREEVETNAAAIRRFLAEAA
jgi:hypothetical protein